MVERRAKAIRLLSLAILALLLAAVAAHAQSSLGIGAAEPAPPPGMFGSWFTWINQQQQAFYRLLTGALREMRQNPSAAWLLVGLSFAYGVFHAAGPGHGKAVITSYMVANEVALKRGVMLSFLSALLQGITAVLLIGAVFLFLRGTAISQTDATWTLEIASYALITAFGLWLLARKLLSLLPRRQALALAGGHGHGHGHGHDHHHDHGHDHHHHGPGETCSECGHAHMPDPAALSGDRFRWRDAWSAVVAVGLRPCSGALIVLTFAFLNGLWWGGVASVLAMSIGTAITVSALATLAVTAKNVALRFAGDGAAGRGIHHAIEIFGALVVFVLGLVLLAASLTA